MIGRKFQQSLLYLKFSVTKHLCCGNQFIVHHFTASSFGSYLIFTPGSTTCFFKNMTPRWFLFWMKGLETALSTLKCPMKISPACLLKLGACPCHPPPLIFHVGLHFLNVLACSWHFNSLFILILTGFRYFYWNSAYSVYLFALSLSLNKQINLILYLVYPLLHYLIS